MLLARHGSARFLSMKSFNFSCRCWRLIRVAGVRFSGSEAAAVSAAAAAFGSHTRTRFCTRIGTTSNRRRFGPDPVVRARMLCSSNPRDGDRGAGLKQPYRPGTFTGFLLNNGVSVGGGRADPSQTSGGLSGFKTVLDPHQGRTQRINPVLETPGLRVFTETITVDMVSLVLDLWVWTTEI